MAMGNWTPTDEMRTKLEDGTYLFASHTFKVALVTSASNIGAASGAFSGVTNEVANGNGYTTGGMTVTITRSGTTDVKHTSPEFHWDATGVGFTARWAVLYDSTSDRVIAYALLDTTPADVTVAAGFRLSITPDPTYGFFDLG